MKMTMRKLYKTFTKNIIKKGAENKIRTLFV